MVALGVTDCFFAKSQHRNVLVRRHHVLLSFPTLMMMIFSMMLSMKTIVAAVMPVMLTTILEMLVLAMILMVTVMLEMKVLETALVWEPTVGIQCAKLLVRLF